MADLAEFMASERLPPSFRLTVQQIYEPLARAIVERRAGRPGFLVGIVGPQGSGKSTGVAVLRLLLQDAGLRVASVTLDDLYLTRDERLVLRRRADAPAFEQHDIGRPLETAPL